jgi:hypothetical protein
MVHVCSFQNESFEAGAISCIDLCGIGKLTHNMVLMGYKVALTAILIQIIM